MKNRTSKRNQGGYTLIEVLVVMSVLSILLVGLGFFMVNTAEDMFWAVNKSKITKDVRHFTGRLRGEAFDANCGYVYDSFSLEDRGSASDVNQSGETGDCLVLISMQPYPYSADAKHYTKLVVYYRWPDDDGSGPVYRIEKSFDTPQPIEVNNGHDHFEDFLASQFAAVDNSSAEIVLELSRGLADGKLFRNFGNNTMVVNGEILHGNEVKEVTNTYNLTIATRG